MKWNIHDVDQAAGQLMELLYEMGRRGSLRDPLAGDAEVMDLTQPQMHTIMWLGHEGPLSMGALAQHAGVTEKSITGIVDRLEREGYVRRVRDDPDRRIVQVRLGDKGRRAFAAFERHMFRKLVGLLSVLDPEDRGVLFRVIEKLSASS